jgi:nucleotide-binding universal stress UspA family protein
LKFAITHAKLTGASVVLAHVLEWSPYTFLTPEELEERHQRRQEELERARKALIEPLMDAVTDEGVKVEAVIRYGHVAETLTKITEQEAASQLFIGRTGHSSLTVRVFGSVAATLAQFAPAPCTIVP